MLYIKLIPNEFVTDRWGICSAAVKNSVEFFTPRDKSDRIFHTCEESVPWEIRFNSALRKHAYSNILKISPPKNWKFSDKNSDIYHISAENIDCGYSLEPPRRGEASTHSPCFREYSLEPVRQGNSNEYPQSMFSSRNKTNNVYPCKKVGLKGVKIIQLCFRDWFFCVCASVVSYVTFILSLFVPLLSFFSCFGKAVLRDGDNSWVSYLYFVSMPSTQYVKA